MPPEGTVTWTYKSQTDLYDLAKVCPLLAYLNCNPSFAGEGGADFNLRGAGRRALRCFRVRFHDPDLRLQTSDTGAWPQCEGGAAFGSIFSMQLRKYDESAAAQVGPSAAVAADDLTRRALLERKCIVSSCTGVCVACVFVFGLCARVCSLRMHLGKFGPSVCGAWYAYCRSRVVKCLRAWVSLFHRPINADLAGDYASSKTAPPSNAVFDESGHFILVPTMLGVKVRAVVLLAILIALNMSGCVVALTDYILTWWFS